MLPISGFSLNTKEVKSRAISFAGFVLLFASVLQVVQIAPAFESKAIAYQSLSGCLAGSGSGTLSGNTVTITVNLRITCTVQDSKDPTKYATFYSLFFMDFPVYEISEDSFAINSQTGFCNGPLLGLTQMVSGTSAGIVTCRIPNTLTSRYGSTSSTLKIFAGDSVFISVSHPAIPRLASAGQAGGSGGTQPYIPTSPVAPSNPVTPLCYTSPSPPVVTVNRDASGATFFVTPVLPVGQSAIGLTTRWIEGGSSPYPYWGTWTAWSPVVESVRTSLNFPWHPYAERIGFAVKAVNSCGSSSDVKSFVAQDGSTILSEMQDQTISLPIVGAVRLSSTSTNDPVPVYASSSSGLSITTSSDFNNVCTPGVNGSSIYVSIFNTGTCSFTLSQGGNSRFNPAPDVHVTFQVLPAAKSVPIKGLLSIRCIKGTVTKRVSGKNPSCPAGFKRK